MSESLSLRLARWLCRIEPRSIPTPQRALANMRVMDTVGLLLASSASPQAGIMRARAHAGSARGGASLVGGGKVEPEWAALAHGVIAHCLDFDDTFPQSVVHPGSVIVPVVLALGEELAAPADDIVAALVGGYEVAARLAGAGGTRFHGRGFHASGIFAPIIAAYVAGRLMRLAPESMASAVGLAASMSGGLMAFTADGAWSKWLHLGWGGFGGILATKLARDGFRGPIGALDGRYNLYEAFIGDPPEDVDARLGIDWEGESALFKYYPCAHVIQPYIDLALGLRREHAISAGDVRTVRCRVAPWAVPIVCEPADRKIAPGSPVEAIASLNYNLALALCDGAVGLEALEERNWTRTDVLSLSRNVAYTADASLTGFAAALEIELRDGREVTAEGDAAAADPTRLAAKFRALAARALDAPGIAALERAVADLDIKAIGTLLAGASR